jgi:hypothetical protein
MNSQPTPKDEMVVLSPHEAPSSGSWRLNSIMEGIIGMICFHEDGSSNLDQQRNLPTQNGSSPIDDVCEDESKAPLNCIQT